MLDCHLVEGVWYIHDLGYWVVYTYILGGFSRLSHISFTHHVISSCNLLVNIKSVESTFLSLSASDEAAAS